MTDDEFCWFRIIPEYGNKLTLCVRENLATFEVYFPNPGYEATTCVQTGPLAQLGKNDFIVSFGEGTCANGRKLGDLSYNCEKVGPVNVKCTDQFGNTEMFDSAGT